MLGRGKIQEYKNAIAEAPRQAVNISVIALVVAVAALLIAAGSLALVVNSRGVQT